MATGLSSSGLNKVACTLINGSTLALCTDEDTPVPVGYRGYADVPCRWGDDDDGQYDHDRAYFTASAGILYNTNYFYWPEADDDETGSSDGWGHVSHLKIRQGSEVLFTGELLNGGADIGQDVQPAFLAGTLRITFTATTVQITA